MAKISERLSIIEVQFLKAIQKKDDESKTPPRLQKRKPRVREIADEYGIDPKIANGVLKEIGEFVKGPSSTIQVPVARKLRTALEERGYLRIAPYELAATSDQNLDSRTLGSSPKSSLVSNRKSEGIGESKRRGRSPKEQLQAKRYVFDRRRLDLRLSEFNRNPTNKNRSLVVSEYHKLHKTVFKRVSDVLERKKLLNQIQEEYLDFNAGAHPAVITGESLLSRVVPNLGENALKPFRGLANRTPEGPQSDTYWDNPVQDR